MYIVQTNKNEKDDTHVTPMWPSSTYAYKHYILFPYDTIYCCCFVIFGLTTNTNEMYQSVNLSIVEMDAVAGVGTRIGFSYSGPGNSSFVWPRISRPPIDRFWPNFQRWKKTISATARRSLPLLQFAVPPLGDRKGKRFPQISRKREGRSSSFWYRSKKLGSLTKLLEYATPPIWESGGGVPLNLNKFYKKIWSYDFWKNLQINRHYKGVSNGEKN